MGILGLTTFVDAHTRLLSDHELHSTSVLVDGNNLYHFLYYYYHVRHECAGDYDEFQRSCRAFFTTLSSCDITPYVVFDGAHDEDGRKFKTSLSRAEERIHLAGFLSYGKRAKILPILTYEVFRNVLDELGVSHTTCYEEADGHIAALSSHWHCPVLTNDSDFFIYNLQAGVILLDYMNLTVRTKYLKKEAVAGKSDCTHKSCDCKVQSYLSVQMYRVKNLMKMFKLDDHRMIAVGATLIGNDVINKSQFNSFYARTKFNNKPIINKSAKPTCKQGARNNLIMNLFQWLSGISEFTKAVDCVVECMNADKQASVKRLILKTVDEYSNISCSELDQQEEQNLSSLVLTAPQSRDGHDLPAWFLDCVRKSRIAARCLGAVTQRKVILLSQVELMNEPSSYECGLFLRRCIYSILLSLDLGDKASTMVAEHDREKKTMKCKKAATLREFAAGVSVPHLDSIPSLTVEYRHMLLCLALSLSRKSVLDNEMLRMLPRDMQLLALTIVYWVTCANPKVGVIHMKALIVCCLVLGGLDSLFEDVSDTSHPSSTDGPNIARDSVSNVVEDNKSNYSVNLDTTCRDEAKQNTNDKADTDVECRSSDFVAAELKRIKLSMLARFASVPVVNNAVAFDASKIHVYSQFQTCLQAAIHLKQLLLLSSFHSLEPASIFNGTFLYNLTRELESRSEPDLYIRLLLERGSAIENKFELFLNVITTLLPDDGLVNSNVAVHSSKKGKKKATLSDTSNIDGDNDSDICDTPSNETTSDLGFKLNNKFSCLEL